MAIIKKDEFIDASGIIKNLQDIRKEIELLKKESKELHVQTRNVNKESTGSEAKKRVDLTRQLETATAKLAAAQTEEAQELAKLRVLQQERNKQLKQAAKEELKLVGAYERQSKQLNELRKRYKDLIVEQGKETKQTKQLRNEISKLDKQLKKVDASVGQHQRNVGNYTKALKGVGTQLLGAAGVVGGVQLLVDGFEKFNETANQVNDLTRKIGTNFGVFGNAAKELASQINAIATTFDEDYNEVLQAANVVSKEFGITGAEATALIEEGFLKGSNNSGEFLDILKEYPTQLKSIGLNAEESFAIINQQVTAGVYSDKGIDALKEAGIRLRENSKAVQESLKVFDADTRAQIENAVARGDVFEATQLISQGIKENGLTAQQTQEIISSVFGGAGEDAQSFVLSLDQVQLSLEDVAIQASESEQASLALSESWNRFVAGVSDSDGIFGKVFAKLKNLLAGAINSLSFLIEKLSGGEKAIDRVRAIVEKYKQTQEESTKAVNDATTATDKNTISRDKNKKAIFDQNSELEQQREEYERLLELQKRADAVSGLEQITSIQATEVSGGFDPLKSAEETTKAVNEMIERENKERRERELEQEQIYQDAIKEISLNTFDNVTGFLKEGRQQDADAQLRALEERTETEKDILKQQLEDGLITQEQFRQKSLELDKKAQRESAKIQKKSSLYNIGIDTAAGIVKALASSPPPTNFINAAIIGAQGALQAALVAAKPLPGFQKGVIGYNGKGTGTSDSNVVRISNNESVITAEGTSKAPLTLKAINEGLLSDSDVIQSSMKKRTSFNFASLLSEQKKTNDYLANGASQIDMGQFIKIIFADGRTSIYPKK
jgi:phage-related minor tail protein